MPSVYRRPRPLLRLLLLRILSLRRIALLKLIILRRALLSRTLLLRTISFKMSRSSLTRLPSATLILTLMALRLDPSTRVPLAQLLLKDITELRGPENWTLDQPLSHPRPRSNLPARSALFV